MSPIFFVVLIIAIIAVFSTMTVTSVHVDQRPVEVRQEPDSVPTIYQPSHP